MEYSLPIRLLLAFLSQDPKQHGGISLGDVTAADWQTLARLSQVQGVTPLLYRRIIDTADNLAIPGNIRQDLREIYFYNLKRNMRLYRRLERILSALAEQHIPVIPLKGVYLAETIYGNIGLRPMFDLDLLLPRADLRRGLILLEDMGYRPSYPIDIEREMQTQHHLPQLHQPGSFTLEIHWTLAPANTPFRIDLEGLWDRSQPAILAGMEIQAMDPDDLLLYLCLHTAYMELFASKLRPICDIALTVEAFKEQLDWERIASRAMDWGAERSTWLALKVTQRLLGIDLPPAAIEYLQPDGYDPVLEDWACEQIFSTSTIGPKLAAAWIPQPWPQRLRNIFRSLFPPVWEMRQKYPLWARGWSWLLAYLIHLRAIFLQNRSTVWQLVQGDVKVKAALEQRSRVNELMDWQVGMDEIK